MFLWPNCDCRLALDPRLAVGYLFTALSPSYSLTFPGAFTPRVFLAPDYRPPRGFTNSGILASYRGYPHVALKDHDLAAIVPHSPGELIAASVAIAIASSSG